MDVLHIVGNALLHSNGAQNLVCVKWIRHSWEALRYLSDVRFKQRTYFLLVHLRMLKFVLSSRMFLNVFLCFKTILFEVWEAFVSIAHWFLQVLLKNFKVFAKDVRWIYNLNFKLLLCTTRFQHFCFIIPSTTVKPTIESFILSYSQYVLDGKCCTLGFH